ncbi:Bro-N domain-containing protein [Campylobacter armoricus]|uniref:BRO-N domain-containing protein n=1 Tax=Campylobacter TaxID=194 RepID=UPI001078903B|nr:Bro-N domain-containing protein [Campylobacter armoricus]EAC1840640.1 antirepressor, BRO family protein [Campylobacter lari]EAH7781091.1 antirepressor, BRO family protein [Campylobacter lari]EAH8420752.1 antirepressor, BRO family protein [Campylobacter lari]EAH8849588.1 antirepressor, BRO family protein [Campylobacter lari]EAI0904326.1 antirepressor, BRO family protein [Campylobacter lari]
MSSVILFENKELGKVRTIRDKNNEPLFCLNDICKILKIQKTTDVKNSILKEFELRRLNRRSFDTGFGIKEFTMIDEPQLYFVLMRSDKPKAKPFRQWVIKEVLPSIRKQGYYAFNNAPKLEIYDNEYDLPDTPYKEKIANAIKEIEQKQNSKFIELIEYEIVEKFKNGKTQVLQKLNFKTKLI